MTRPSRRELESALDDVDVGVSSTEQWMREFLERRLERGFELDFSSPSADDVEEETVCILTTEQFAYFVPREDVPEWLDLDADLPLEEGSA